MRTQIKKGDKFNKLTFVKDSGFRKVPSGGRRKMGLFRCDCGKETVVSISNATRQAVKSCGCVGVEKIRTLGKRAGLHKASYRHGMYGTKFYTIYFGIASRCKGKTKHYETVKNEFNSFEHFQKTMFESFQTHIAIHGERQTTIDRINSKGNYSQENCRWANYTKQARNRKNNTLVTLHGKTKTLAEWKTELNTSAWFVKKLAVAVPRKPREVLHLLK